MPSYAVMPGQI